MSIHEKERRRPLLAIAAITIALLLPTIRVVTGPASPGRFVGVAVASGEGAHTPAATNRAPTVAGKTAPALKTAWASRICRAFGPEMSTYHCSGPPGTASGSFLLTQSAPSLIDELRILSAETATIP